MSREEREEAIARFKEESAKHIDITKRVRHSSKYQKWQKKIIRRDEYTCQKCKKQIFSGLHVHHKESFNWIILKNEITTIRQALDCEELWDIDNGISLCKNCHLIQIKEEKIEFLKEVDKLIIK